MKLEYATNTLAKLLTLRKGLEHAIKLNIHNLEINIDSQVVLELLTTNNNFTKKNRESPEDIDLKCDNIMMRPIIDSKCNEPAVKPLYIIY